jgi:uncharacterized membrane protein
MRRILDGVSLIALLLLIVASGLALFGPKKLPSEIPTHLDAYGQPDAWASRTPIEVVPFIAIAIFLGLAAVAKRSSAALDTGQGDSGQKVNADGQPAETSIHKLIAWLRAELLGILACVELSSIHTARNPGDSWSLWSVGTWGLVVAVFITAGWYAMTLFRPEPEPAQAPAPQAAEQLHTWGWATPSSTANFDATHAPKHAPSPEETKTP